MNKQENELLLMILSEMKDMKRMQEHQGEMLNEMRPKLDYVYNLALDNYGAIKEHDTRFKLLEGRIKAPRSRLIRKSLKH